MSRILRFNYDVLLNFGTPVHQHSFVLRCMPSEFSGQQVLDVSLRLNPACNFSMQKDGFGNLIQVGRIDEAHDVFHYMVQGTVKVDLSRRMTEEAHPMYNYSTKLTQPEPALASWLVQQCLSENSTTKAYELAVRVHTLLTYKPGVTNVTTTAADAFSRGCGVCQDYAHLYLTLARMCGIPARYVNGLVVGEGASHAWCEVWLDGYWTAIDPTRGCWADERYIRFNVGRDFEDCPMERGVFVGITDQQQTVKTKVISQ